MSAPEQATTAPAPAATQAPVAPAPGFTAADLQAAVVAAMRAEREEQAKASAKAAADPVAAAQAEIAAMRASADERVAAERKAAAAERDRYHTRARLLERSGCVDADAALALEADLLKADDAEAALDAVRKKRPYLFAAQTPASPAQAANAAVVPAPRTMPATSVVPPASIPADVLARAKSAGISVESLQQAYARRN